MASWSDIEPEEIPIIASGEADNVQKKPPFSLELSSREDEFRLVHLKRCFNRCDKDSDGFIDSKALRKLCVMLEMPQFASGESATALFKALDVNSLGKIAFKDFLRYKDIYLRSALAVGDKPTRILEQTGSLSPSSSVTTSSYQEGVMSMDSELETGHTFESPGHEARSFPHRTDQRRLPGASDSSESPDNLETGAKGEKRRIRPSSAGLTSGNSTRKVSRPSSAELRYSDFAHSNPSLSLRAKSYTFLSASSCKDETVRTRKRSSSSGYIHQLLSIHQQPSSSEVRDREAEPEPGEDDVTSLTPVYPQPSKFRKKLSSLDSPIFNPSLPSNSLPLEALPSAPVCVLQSMCQDGSDHVSMSEIMELLQALGFDQNDISEDVDRVLQEVPRDGEGRLSVIGVALAMERILVGEEDVPEGSFLRQLSLKLYQQEIIIWRRTHQISMAEKGQLLENLDYHRGEQRRLLNWGDEQAELEALHWDLKLRDIEHKHKLKLRSIEDSKREELDNLMEKTTKELEDREKTNRALQNESDQLRDLVKDLKADYKYMCRQLDEYKIKSIHSERLIEALQLQQQDSGLSQFSDIPLDTEIGRSELDRVIDEKNQLMDSHKYLQDNYDELQAENQKIQQQLRTLQIRFKHSVKALAARPVTAPKMRPPLPRNRHSMSLNEPPQLDGGASPDPGRRDNLMVEMIDHDFQAQEKLRMTHLEELCTDLELRLEQLDIEKKAAETKLFETEQDRDRVRQKKKKDDKITNSRISDLESDNIQLNVLKSDAEDRLNDTQSTLSKRTTELNEIQKEFAILTRKLADFELQFKSLSSQNADLEQSGKENEQRESNLVNERTQLKKQVQLLQSELSTCKSKYDTHSFELERLLAESEQHVSRLKLENEHNVKRIQQDLQASQQLITEMKKENSQLVNNLEKRIEELDNSLSEATQKHKQEVEIMSDEIRKAVDREKSNRDEKHAIELKLAEVITDLGEVTKSRDAGDRARVNLNETLDRNKLERDQLDKQLKSELAILQTTHGEVCIKLDQAEANHKQLLNEVRTEYENQITKLHQEIRDHIQSAVSTESKSKLEITSLTAEIESYKKELCKLEALLTRAKLESSATEDEKRFEVDNILQELESCRAEMDLNSETYFERVNQLKEKLSCMEEKLNDVTLHSELERNDLEENIQNYEEREKLLIEEYEMRLLELQTKFDNEITARSLEEEKIAEEMEQLSLELTESRKEIKRIQEGHLEEIQKFKQEELASLQNLNNIKKSKEIEITKLRNSLIDCESKIRAFEQADSASSNILLRKSHALDSVTNELEFSHNARKHLEKQLEISKKELQVAKQENVESKRKFQESLRDVEDDKRLAELEKLKCISEIESKYSLITQDLKRGIETRQTEINLLKLRLIEADSIRAGDDLNAQWKSHIQELTSQIRELERQVKSKESIIEQIRKDTKEFNEFKHRMNHFKMEKEALISVIEEISHIEDSI
ncbi:hypothetical protein LOD99_1358 [Oopsacas minuta]|uniref:EF-hand domain-containing protein n=1 Tax=Oopsacas minuta TaxID=111878 RepID=A0AAV7K5Y1_9METZ|nr:hypothetical protein LOD99_1358 [Oopsacas minuta]